MKTVVVDLDKSTTEDGGIIEGSERAFSENDNLIVCSSELASSLQDAKLEKSRLHPGHYLHKVFKLKSQSAPSLEKKKNPAYSEDEKGDQDPKDCSSPLIKDGVVDESRFKTWPSCIEKTPSDSSEEDVKVNPPVPLDNLLHSLPLAYSPITKQIHLLKREDNTQIQVKVDEDSDLHRVPTDASLFSSNVSSLSDVSPEGGSAFMEPEDTCSLVSIGNCSLASDDGDAKKRKGIAGFLSRGVFSWKGKTEAERWSLFGKSQTSLKSSSEDSHSVGGDSGLGVQGSTALIQLERPAWLPAKSKQEHRAHADQHDKIINSARKREIKEAKQRKKQLLTQLKVEDDVANATKVWIHDILPRWHQTRTQKRTQDLWWQGVPPCVRGKLWTLAINNDLNITRELYDICVTRAQDRLSSTKGSSDSVDDLDKEASLELIQLDISRTFPSLCIFQKGGPYYDILHSLLAAYVCYRPDLGYVQGMSFIAAILILNMDAPEAFICFANLLNRPCHRSFFSLDQPVMEAYYDTYRDLLQENLPSLSSHMKTSKLTPDLYLMDWIYTIFTKTMSLDLVSRVWDVFLRDGEEFLFRAALGVLHLYQDVLLKMDFLTGSKFLTRLPEDLCIDQLFKSINSIRMTSGKRSFSQILNARVHAPG